MNDSLFGKMGFSCNSGNMIFSADAKPETKIQDCNGYQSLGSKESLKKTLTAIPMDAEKIEKGMGEFPCWWKAIRYTRIPKTTIL